LIHERRNDVNNFVYPYAVVSGNYSTLDWTSLTESPSFLSSAKVRLDLWYNMPQISTTHTNTNRSSFSDRQGTMPDKSQPSFPGFELPEQNWFRLPNAWTDITCDITSLAELKVVEYVLRHTWGFREFGVAKRISIDEFMRGRRRNDGSRMDRGTGLSKPSVIEGLRKAVADAYLIETKDSTDKGRIKKFYSLRMKPQASAMDSLNDQSGPDASAPGGPVKTPDPDVKNLNRGVKKLDTRGLDALHRSEKDTLERHYTVTINGEKEKKGTSSGTPKPPGHTRHPVSRLPRIGLPTEQTELLARDMAVELEDRTSLPFYRLVAQRVPERAVRRHLAEIKVNGAKHPAKLFNYRIRRYVEDRLARAKLRQ
jgi:hypothetical protein